MSNSFEIGPDGVMRFPEPPAAKPRKISVEAARPAEPKRVTFAEPKRLLAPAPAVPMKAKPAAPAVAPAKEQHIYLTIDLVNAPINNNITLPTPPAPIVQPIDMQPVADAMEHQAEQLVEAMKALRPGAKTITITDAQGRKIVGESKPSE